MAEPSSLEHKIELEAADTTTTTTTTTLGVINDSTRMHQEEPIESYSSTFSPTPTPYIMNSSTDTPEPTSSLAMTSPSDYYSSSGSSRPSTALDEVHLTPVAIRLKVTNSKLTMEIDKSFLEKYVNLENGATTGLVTAVDTTSGKAIVFSRDANNNSNNNNNNNNKISNKKKEKKARFNKIRDSAIEPSQTNATSIKPDIQIGIEDPSHDHDNTFIKHPTSTLVPLLLGLVLAHFVAALDATIIASAFTQIGADLKAPQQIIWVSISYLLTFNAIQPLVGKFCKIFGHRALMLLGVLIFTAGSAGCGAASTMGMMIGFRIFQGIGGATVWAMALIVVSDLFPLEERPKYMALFWLSFGVSFVSGPLIGKFLGEGKKNTRWRFLLL
jgi:hypothetical protein